METEEKSYRLSKVGISALKEFVAQNCRAGVSSDLFCWEGDLDWEGDKCYIELRGEYTLDKLPKTRLFKNEEVEEAEDVRWQGL